MFSISSDSPSEKNTNLYLYSQNCITGICLLILAVSGNFISETLSCKTQKILKQSMYAKHFVILLILYFAIHFTKTKQNMHPLRMFLLALTIYLFFLLFTKMNIYFTTIVIFLICICLVVSTFIDYYDKKKNDNQQTIILLQKCFQLVYFLTMFITLIGFINYFTVQYKDHKSHWSTMKFLFGVIECTGNNEKQ